ncbi:hypothetical protein [Burkholderia cenocepacia]|uniref:hypothetical protein n=1 Tax=Burkholderia cenocepacia TaxID=95486 RepID=UPI002231F70D|nr:hypothetical protein [Burkholderia cenocepacia]MCW3609154.1 hypothetical protein [Burkholderia cenocepacia]MCW5189878.1 hypothetical protein [Burkholderia cenocepacia]
MSSNLAIALAVGGFAFGVAGAGVWFRSARVDLQQPSTEPGDRDDPFAIEPVEHEQKLLWMHVRQMRATEANWNAVVDANREMGRLNQIAARLTAVALVLSTLSTLVG